MTTLREAAQKALGVLERWSDWSLGRCGYPGVEGDVAKTSLQIALQKQEAKEKGPAAPTTSPLVGSEPALTAWESSLDSMEPEQRGQAPDADCHAQGICQKTGYGIPLYAPTYRREPLTDAQIAKALAGAGLRPEDYREDGQIEPLVRAIEHAHGIGSKK